MNDQYKTLHQEAVNLQFRFRDCLEDKSQPASREMESEIQKLVDEFEAQTNPRSIEDLITRVQAQLKSLHQNVPPVMDNNKAEGLHDDFERLRMRIRELDNY